MDVCTIIAKNYLAPARVLARSFAEQHPDVRFHVLIIDEIEGYVDPATEPFEVVTIDQLGIERFADMAVMYNVLELSTAVKPWLLRYLLAQSDDNAVVYLDPDMRLYAPLDEMFAAVRRHGLVLSPHNLGPMPRDGRKPNEQDILIAGVYNLGFVGINAGAFADELLDWWGVRLERDCIVDPERGFFVDQRWMDFAPGMAESFHLLRDPGFNVAYWNLHARPVSRREDRWFVADDVPLRLFHFSGYDYRRPDTLSKHQNRIDLLNEPGLKQLCDAYGEALQADGAAEVSILPYTYSTTASGIPLDGPLRRIYRELALNGFNASPFEPEGEAAFLAELNAPAHAGGAVGVTRYLEALHGSRVDLQRAYPDLDADGAGFVGWAHEWGRPQVPIPDALLPPAPNGAAPNPEPEPEPDVDEGPPLGVNVAGYLTSEMGVGEVARQMTGALDAAGIPALPVGITAPRGRHGHGFAGASAERAAHPVNLVCVNADMLPQFAADAGPAFFEHRYTIGLWWWEVAKFPERWRGAFQHVDEIWAGSRFVADALAAVSPVPVTYIPTPVSLPAHPPVARAALGLPEDGFLYLFVYDYNSILARKNPLGAIEAFTSAFPDADEGAKLVLKSINADLHPEDHAQVLAAAEGHPHIQLLDQFLSPADKNRLISSCDAYVSLHRSEGFGITMAEAMQLGKPVIATGFSGNTDFMTSDNSWPVRYRLTPIGPGADPYPADGEWAEPDLEHAAACLREVFEQPELVAERGTQATRDIWAGHSVGSVGERIATRLAAIELDPLAVPAPAAEARSHADAADYLVGRGTAAPPTGRRPLPGRDAARKAVLRTIKPHTAHQAGLDRQLSSGMRELADEVNGLARRLLNTDTATLRELRALERRLAALETVAVQATPVTPRIDDLAAQVDELRREQERVTRVVGGSGLFDHDVDDVDADAYPVAPDEPWTHEYNDAHRAFVSRELDDPALTELFRKGEPLPVGFGTGFDERVVEYPWIAAQALGGRVLDAGSTLNHLHVLQRLRMRMDDLHIVTLAPEEHSYPGLGVSYLYADLRKLPFSDETYDRVISISTLEHVGMDNTYYGDRGGAAGDPQPELLEAIRELRRVLRPGGDCYITVPAGSGERFSWVRTFTSAELDEVIEVFAPARHTLSYFRYTAEGWNVSDRDAVAEETYRDHFTSGAVGSDRAVAARAVACLHLVR